MKKEALLSLVIVGVIAFSGMVHAGPWDSVIADTGTWTRAYGPENVGFPEKSEAKSIGWKIITYDVTRHGGSVSNNLLTDVIMPTNAIVMQAIINVIDQLQPLDMTNAITLQTSGDIYAASTNLANAADNAIIAGVPVDTAATAIKMTAPRTLNFQCWPAATNGTLKIFLKYYQSQ